MTEAAPRRKVPVGDRVALAAVVVVLVVLVLSSASSDSSSADRDLDFGAVWLLGLATGFATLGRRLPATGALANMVTTVAWYQIGYASGLINVPYLVAFYLLGASGDRRRQLLVGGLAVGLTTGSMIAMADESTASAVSAVGWTVAALLLGELTHSRRELLDALEARAVRAEAERDLEATRRVAQARLEIARDLHDVLAHTVSVMTVQAGVGHDALRRNTGGAEAALLNIKAAGRKAIAEVRALVTVLREGAAVPSTSPAPRLAGLAELAAATRATGIEVEASVDVPEDEVPEVVELTAYRVVQESLTNVVRHARAQRARVSVRRTGGDVLVEVGDDGRGQSEDIGAGWAPSQDAEDGFGLRGMRERVESLGGTLAAGPGPEGGWRVLARIPCDPGATR